MPVTRTSQRINQFRRLRWQALASGMIGSMRASRGTQASPVTFDFDLGSLLTVQLLVAPDVGRILT